MTGFESLWQQRYGERAIPLTHTPEAASAVLAQLMSHRTVRAYLDQPLPAEALALMMAAAQSAATSSNLQTWSVIAVEDRERKARLADFAGSQAHIREAPLLLIWLADLSRLDRTAQRREAVSDANRFMEMFLVAAIDATLAAQNAVLAAEALGLGTSYIGAMRNKPEQVAAELQLPARVFPVFGLTVGHPDPSRPTAIKPRLPQSLILSRETYRAPADAEVKAVAEYDELMLAFQRSQSMKPVPWSEQSTQRVAGPGSLSGRDRLVDAIHATGFQLD
jgi:nitroreductase